MPGVTFTIDPDELLGLNALATLDKAAEHGGPEPDVNAGAVHTARTLLRAALAQKLAEAELPWAPPAGSVSERAALAAEPAGAMRRLAENKKLRNGAAYVLTVVALTVVWGGYARRWSWTGFQANNQLWDWLQLLLLPAVAASVPLWIQYRKFIGRARTIAYGGILAALIAFVIAGYLIPLSWTGFQGQTLWNWFQLVLLPTAVACTLAMISKRVHPVTVLRTLRPHHMAISGALVSGWIVTVAGGYGLKWGWTGYSGNTLWDWLQLLLVPLVLPTFLLPAFLRWASGNAAERAHRASVAAAGPAAPAAPAAPAGSEAAGEAGSERQEVAADHVPA
jgi:putative effector of murein hydrolase